MADHATPLASLRRLRAVLALRTTTLSSLAKKIGCTPSHLRVVVLGRRAVSPALRTKLEREVRPDEWRFARGEADLLRDVSDDISPSGVEGTAAGPAAAPADAALVAPMAPITSAAIGGADMHDGRSGSAPARARRGRDHLEPPARRKHDEA